MEFRAVTTTPPRPYTDARKRATSASHAKRREAGLKATTVWLTPDAQAKLEELKAASGLSANEAINRAILAMK